MHECTSMLKMLLSLTCCWPKVFHMFQCGLNWLDFCFFVPYLLIFKNLYKIHCWWNIFSYFFSSLVLQCLASSFLCVFLMSVCLPGCLFSLTCPLTCIKATLSLFWLSENKVCCFDLPHPFLDVAPQVCCASESVILSAALMFFLLVLIYILERV